MEKNEITALVQRSQSGDKDAFLALYKEFHGKVSFFVRRLTNNSDAAADLTSETFAAAMERINELHSGESFSGWLYSIAYNKCMQYINEKKRSVTLSSEAELEELIESAALNEPLLLPDDYAINAETRVQLQSIIDSLSPDQRSAVIMYYYDEMSVSEVAEAMGTNENNVSQKLHRARKKIRTQIEKLISKGAMFGAVPMRVLLGDIGASGAGLTVVGAAAVGIPYGLSKASGGTARELLWITRKYWSKHKKSLAALLFSGVLLCAVMVGTFLQIRSDFNSSLHARYDEVGMYDVMLVNVPDEVEAELTAKKAPKNVETVCVLDEKADLYGNAFTCGYADGSAELMHLPFESGRLPQSADEVAITRAVADKIGWSGRTGDTILLNGRRVTVSGIIGSKYDLRRFSENNDAGSKGGNAPSYPVPSVYIAKDDTSTTSYTVKMYSGIAEGEDDSISWFGISAEEFMGFMGDRLGGGKAAEKFDVIDLKGFASSTANSDQFRQKVRWFILIASIAAVIAVLSVFTVLRLIFNERRSTYEMLHSIGVSNRRMRVMYAVECLMFTLIQTVLGTALGVIGYFGIHTFEVKALDSSDHSAFTTDRLVISNTVDPFLIGIITAVAVMTVGYFATLLFGKEKKPSDKKRRPCRTVFGCMGKILGSRGITVIQTLSLTLIMFGSMLGYMYFTDSGKNYLNYLSYEPPVSYQLTDDIDMKNENIAEYYSCMPPIVMFSGSNTFGLPLTDPNYIYGLDDSDISKFGEVTACGTMRNTFVILDEPVKGGHKGRITFKSSTATEEEIKELLISSSSESSKDFFSENGIGSKALYSIETKIANADFIEKLRNSVVEGEIDIEALGSGREVIAVLTNTSDKMLYVGNELKIGSILKYGEFGIGEVSSGQAKIGAVVQLNETDAIDSHILQNDIGFSLLTTQSGAEALGIFNAKYTEVFSDHHIDGGLIPTGAGMTLISLEVLEHKAFVEKATKLGGFIILVLIMAVLGFAAYFNGIGMKIRLKEYQLSVLRAIGASKGRIRLRLFFNNIKIPVISAAAAGCCVIGVQKFFLSMYEKMIAIPIQNENGVIELTEEINNKQHDMISRYFLNSEMWQVSVFKPMIAVFATVMVITVMLMLLNMRRLDSRIAESMSKGRKRR